MALSEIHNHIKGGQLVASGISIYYFERCVIHASPPFPFFLISTIRRNRNKNMKCWLSGKAIDFYKYIYHNNTCIKTKIFCCIQCAVLRKGFHSLLKTKPNMRLKHRN